MSAFPNSGRSDSRKMAISSVRFRPEADIERKLRISAARVRARALHLIFLSVAVWYWKLCGFDVFGEKESPHKVGFLLA